MAAICSSAEMPQEVSSPATTSLRRGGTIRPVETVAGRRGACHGRQAWLLLKLRGEAYILA